MSWDEFVQQISSEQEVMEEEDWQKFLTDMEDLHTHPLNINTATAEELARIPFLSPMQIEEIHAYVSLDGPMKTLGEIQLIRGLPDLQKRILPLFVYAGEKPKTDDGVKFWQGAKHQLDTRMDIPLYLRKGQQVSETSGYAGDPLYHRLRYTLDSRHLGFGVRLEKDPGETFYDSYGGFLVLKDLGRRDDTGHGIVRQIIVGDYLAGWGEGLVMSASSSSSKNSLFSGNGRGVRPLTSTMEDAFLRGVSLTLGQSTRRQKGWAWQATMLASYRQQDATLNEDGTIRTIQTTGYHRTVLERSRKNNVEVATIGAHMVGVLRTTRGILTLGGTGYWQHYSSALSPGDQLYRQIYPKGQDFGAIGVHYGYSAYRFDFSGETAYSTEKGGVATLARMSWIVSRSLKLALMGRYFSEDYYSFHAASMAENSKVQNETGAMASVEYQWHRNWLLTAWADFFSDTWPRYQMTHSSIGQEFMVGTTGTLGRHTLMFQYQLKRKERVDVMNQNHRFRTRWTYETAGWKLQTAGVVHLSQIQEMSTGFGISQLLQRSAIENRLRLTAMLGYFNTNDYDSRIYLYDPSLWGSTSSGMYYGDGIRGVITVRYTLPRGHWTVEAKYGITDYMDRDQISSGLQTIFSGTKQDIALQLLCKY